MDEKELFQLPNRRQINHELTKMKSTLGLSPPEAIILDYFEQLEYEEARGIEALGLYLYKEENFHGEYTLL